MNEEKMSDEYTDNELNELGIIEDDLIIEIFDSRDKRYAIIKALKKAFILGKHCKFPKTHKE